MRWLFLFSLLPKLLERIFIASDKSWTNIQLCVVACSVDKSRLNAEYCFFFLYAHIWAVRRNKIVLSSTWCSNEKCIGIFYFRCHQFSLFIKFNLIFVHSFFVCVSTFMFRGITHCDVVRVDGGGDNFIAILFDKLLLAIYSFAINTKTHTLAKK